MYKTNPLFDSARLVNEGRLDDALYFTREKAQNAEREGRFNEIASLNMLLAGILSRKGEHAEAEANTANKEVLDNLGVQYESAGRAIVFSKIAECLGGSGANPIQRLRF